MCAEWSAGTAVTGYDCRHCGELALCGRSKNGYGSCYVYILIMAAAVFVGWVEAENMKSDAVPSTNDGRRATRQSFYKLKCDA